MVNRPLEGGTTERSMRIIARYLFANAHSIGRIMFKVPTTHNSQPT